MYSDQDWSVLPPELNRRFNPGLNMATIKQAINETIERVRTPTPMRLRDLIRQIRAARTAAEERAVVNKECAYIRSTFREEDSVWRCRNIAKLLYIHMLGYPAHFGQLECLKLIASPRFTDKRIGYLGAMLLLDERQDVHLLITNCLKNDLNSSTQFVVGLALCTLGAIASPEMARDLATEVERLMKSPNAYIKKKAALCAFRIIKKVPELMEIFLPATRSLLTEKNHGVLITGVTLITEMCEISSDTLNHFKKIVTNLVRILKNLILAGYSPEHDVSGVSDPFLQVKILRLLRVLGRNDVDASEAMNDILAQVATNTETSKNVGNTILYETVLSIMDIKSESGLRVLAVNILGRFLLNNDKNIRYVALNTLLKTVYVDTSAVQRHRSTILECLKDPDVSIRKRAMDLSFALINHQNVKIIMKELLIFLERSDSEFKAQCSSNIVLSAERFSPSKKWHLDTLLKVLVAAGNYVRDDVISSTIQLISDTDTHLQQYIVGQLWHALAADQADKQPLTQVAAWAIGEYGDILQKIDSIQKFESSIVLDAEQMTQQKPSEEQVIEVYQKLLWSPQHSIVTKQYLIMSLIKLSTRFQNVNNKIKEIVSAFGSSLNIELQQRGVEFTQLFGKYDPLRPALLERMPPMELHRNTDDNDLIQENIGNGQDSDHEEFISQPDSPQNHNPPDSQILLDLLGGDISSPTKQQSQTNHMEKKYNLTNNHHHPIIEQQSSNNTQDLLDLLGSFDSTQQQQQTFNSSGNHLSETRLDTTQLNLFNTSNDVLSLNSTNNNILFENSNKQFPSLINNYSMVELGRLNVYDKQGLSIEFVLEKDANKSFDSSNKIVINMLARNSSESQLNDFLFQAAVPKSFQLEMLTPSDVKISPGECLTQSMKVMNTNNAILKMRIRISYSLDGNLIQDQCEVNNFPTNLWQ